MRLWTWQTRDFDLTNTKEKVDHTKSKYYGTGNGIPEAYEELHRRLGRDQLIWCYLHREDHSETPITCEIEREWELEAPEDEDHVLFIDDLVWNKILGGPCAFPTHLQSWLYDEALKKNPRDSCQQKQFEQQIEDELWEPEPSEVLWDKLILATLSEAVVPGWASALVRHPIPCTWVIKS